MKISIVTTIYNSADTVQALHARLSAAAENISDDYEIIFVNDGSKDDSLERLVALQAQDKHVVVIDLIRNFGQHPAIMTGLAHSRGDFVFVIDGDLEESPEWLAQYWAVMQEKKVDIVFGDQKRRRERWLGAHVVKAYYWFMARMLRMSDMEDLVTARLMSRVYVDALLQYKDKSLVLSGLCHQAGFQCAHVDVDKTYKGSSSYTPFKKAVFAVEFITCATSLPLIWVCFGGLGVAVILYPVLLFLLLITYVFGGIGGAGFFVSAGLLTLMAGLFGAMAILSAYLLKIKKEMVEHPLTSIRKVYRAEA